MSPEELLHELGEHKSEWKDSSEPVQRSDPQSPLPEKNQPEAQESNPQLLYRWRAPMRAYKHKAAGVFRFYFAVAVLMTVITLFFREFVLIIPIWSLMFLAYTLTVTQPPDIDNIITRFGIQSGMTTYTWDSLSHFYFIRKFDYHILVLFTKAAYTHPIYLVIPSDQIKSEVLLRLSDKLMYQENPHKTLTDKMAEWLTTLMPEEENQAHVEAQQEQPLSHQTFEPTAAHLHQQ